MVVDITSIYIDYNFLIIKSYIICFMLINRSTDKSERKCHVSKNLH